MKRGTIKFILTLLFLVPVFVPWNLLGAEEQPPGEGTTAAELDRIVDEDRPTLSADVTFMSQYVWRGYGYSKDSLVIQPSVTAGYKGFNMLIWGNFDTDYAFEPYKGESKWNETDFAFYYGHNFGIVGLEGGFVYYALDGIDDSKEFFISIGLDVILAPTLTVYREVSCYQGWYINLGLGHSFELPYDMLLNLAGSFGYYDSDNDTMLEFDNDLLPTGKRFSGLHDGLLSVGLTIPFWKYFTVTPSIAYAFPLSHQADNEMQALSLDGKAKHLFGGVTLSMAF